MGLLAHLAAERRASLENPSTSFSDPDVWDALDIGGTGKTSSGANVNARSANSVAAFYAGVRFISSTIAQLPLKLYRRTADGREAIEIDPRLNVWRIAPNPQMSAYTFRQVLQGHLTTWGNAYIEVVRDNAGRVVQGWPLLPDRTKREFFNGRVTYVTEIGNGEKVRLPDEHVMHVPGFGFDGRSGYSMLSLARETLGRDLAAGQQAGAFYANGLRPSGVLTSPAALNPTTRQKLRESVKEQTGGLTGTQRLLLLEGGITFAQMGIPPGDAQFLEQRQYEVVEIARFLNLPPHVLRDLSKSSFSNIEQQSLELVIYSLGEWIHIWESALNKDMLTPEEQQTMFFKVDPRGLLRGDSKARMDYLQGRFNTGSITPNEIRAIEDENTVEGGDQLFIHSAMVPLAQAGSMSVDDRAKLLGAPTDTRTDGVGQYTHTHVAANTVPLNPLVRDVWERLCRGEVRELKRLAKKGGDVNDYYEGDFVEFATRTLKPLGGDTEALVKRYAFDARQQFNDLAPDQIILVLESWGGRAETWANGG